MRESDKDLLEAEVPGKIIAAWGAWSVRVHRIVDVGLAMVLMGGHFFYDLMISRLLVLFFH